MSNEKVKPWYSDVIVANTKNAKMVDRLKVGPSSIGIQVANNTNANGTDSISITPAMNTSYIYDKKFYLQGKPTLIFTGTTVNDPNGYDQQFVPIAGGAGSDSLYNAWTGQGGAPRFFLPNCCSLQNLPLNRCLESDTLALNGQSVTGYDPVMKNTLCNFLSEEAKMGKELGIFTPDAYESYTYFSPTHPLSERDACASSVAQAGALFFRKPRYPYRSDINDPPSEKNILAKRWKQLPPYTTRFAKIVANAPVDIGSVTLSGIEVPWDASLNAGAGGFYWGPLQETITFTEPLIEPYLHPLTKFDSSDTDLFLSNISTFELKGNVRTSKMFRTSQSFDQLNCRTISAANQNWTTLVVGNFNAVVQNNSLSSVQCTIADWKLSMIRYTIPNTIERSITTRIPFYKDLVRSENVPNMTASQTVVFDTFNLGNIPSLLLIDSFCPNLGAYQPDCGALITNIQIGLGTDTAIFSKDFDLNQLQRLTRKNGYKYDWKKERHSGCNYTSLSGFISNSADGTLFVNQYANALRDDVAVSKITGATTAICGDWSKPNIAEVNPSQHYIVLDFTDDIVSMAHNLSAGAKCNLQFNLSVTLAPRANLSAQACTIRAHLISKAVMEINSVENSSAISQELFSETDVLHAVSALKGKSIVLHSDMMIGGGINFSSIWKAIKSFLPKIREYADTAVDMYGKHKHHLDTIIDKTRDKVEEAPAGGRASHDLLKGLRFGSA